MTYPTFGLEGKRVVVTGAGGGIGHALVTAFHAAGASIIACDRDEALLDTLPAKTVAERHLFDMTDRDAVLKAGREIKAPDILVNNAGFTRADTYAMVDDEVVARELQLNLTATIDLTRALLPAMIEKGGGSIVFISSVNAIQHFGNPIYSVAKAGHLAFARGLAVEYGRQGIRANSVCPGSVITPAWEHRIKANPGLLDDLAKYYPRGQAIKPEEVANAALFLASPLASGITGVTLPVDAGLTAGNLRLVRDIIDPDS